MSITVVSNRSHAFHAGASLIVQILIVVAYKGTVHKKILTALTVFSCAYWVKPSSLYSYITGGDLGKLGFLNYISLVNLLFYMLHQFIGQKKLAEV